MSHKDICALLKDLEYKYYILDMMNNNIISSMYKNKLINEINSIIDTLKECNK